MSSDEEHEISAEKTRRDKARKLWNLMHRVPPELFGKICYPAMKSHYPHVLEGVSFCWCDKGDLGVQCLRHIIMKRMTLRRFADIFPSSNACTHAEYWFDICFTRAKPNCCHLIPLFYLLSCYSALNPVVPSSSIFSCSAFSAPKRGWTFLMSATYLESQGCYLILHFFLLSCCSA